MHKAVRIRERYLTALEEERWEMLPGDAYTKGFLRTYAEYLGLDGQLYIDEFNARLAQRDEEPLVPDALRGRAGVSPILFRTIGAVVVLGAAIGGLVAWRQAGGSERPRIESVAAGRPAHKQVAHRPAAAPVAKPAVAQKPTFALIRAARDESWLSVRVGGPSGREIFRGTLLPGQSLKYGLSRAIWVRMGRPLALDIHIGKTLVAGLPEGAANIVLTRNGAER